MTSQRLPSDWPSSRLAGLLSLAMFTSTFSVAALSALGPFLTEVFTLSGTQFGALSSVIFLAAALLSPWVGRWVDSASQRHTMLILFSVSGLSFGLVTMAPNYPWLLTAMAASGLAVAFGNPVTNAVLSKRDQATGRGWLVGIKQAGQPVNMIVAGAVLPPIAVALSWRGAFGVGVVVSVAGVLLVTNAVPAVSQSSGEQGLGRDAALPRPRPPRAVIAIASYAFLMGSAMAGFVAYLPLYAYQELDIAPAVAGTATGMIGVTGAASRVGWGRAAESARSSAWPLVAVACGAIVGVLLVFAAAPARSWLLWVGAGVFGATGHSWNAAGSVVMLRETDRTTIGRASGVVQLTFYTGLTASPIIVGSINDLAGSLRPAMVLLMGVYTLAAAVAAVWGLRARHRVARSDEGGSAHGSG